MRPSPKPRPAILDKKFGPKSGKLRLTNATVRDLQPKTKDYLLSDTEVRGLKLKVTPAGNKSFVLRYRNDEGSERKYKIGDFPATPVALAREQAKKVLAEVVQGADPSHKRRQLRSSPTFREFADTFMQSHAVPYLSAATVRGYRNTLDKHILPRIGHMRLQSIAKQDIRDLHQALAETPYQANRVINLIRTIFNRAEEMEAIPPGHNPARQVKRYREQNRERILSAAEKQRLAQTIEAMRAKRPALASSIDAISLLFLTGLRLNEVLSLNWSDIDFEHGVITLKVTKTVPRQYPIIPVTRDFLTGLYDRRTSEFLFPNHSTQRPLKSVKKAWNLIRDRADLPGFRIHDFRHSFGSSMAANGADIATISAVLGHTDRRTTERYVHAQSDTLRLQLAKTANPLATLLRGDSSEE